MNGKTKVEERERCTLGVILVDEAKGDASGVKGSLTIRIIQAGLNLDGDTFYKPEALKAAVPLYEGSKMYLDHQSDMERYQYPVGQIEKWVGVIESARWNNDASAIEGTARIIDPEFRDKVALLKEANMLTYLGVSHRSLVRGRVSQEPVPGEVPIHVVEEVVRVVSVDFVTEPGAGGVTLAAEAKGAVRMDQVTITADEHKKLIDTIKTTQEALDVANATIARMQQEQQHATIVNHAREKLEASSLPPVARERIRPVLEAMNKVEDVDTFIACESEYVAKLLTNTTVKQEAETKEVDESVKGFGNGSPTNAPDGTTTQATSESVVKMYLKRGYSEQQAQQLAKEFMA